MRRAHVRRGRGRARAVGRAGVGGGGPSNAIGNIRLLIVPRRFMREVVSCPTKQPFLKSTPFSKSRLASMG